MAPNENKWPHDDRKERSMSKRTIKYDYSRIYNSRIYKFR